jgi:hypothetical protein
VKGAVRPLPPHSRLLHLGLPKTGTTTVQRGAALNRAALSDHGVCYPGQRFNHREPVAALMGRSLGWRGRGAAEPALPVWDALMREVRAAEDAGARISYISHEFGCESDDRQAARFVQELAADRLQVVLTLRGFADLLPSNWQQFVKSGYTGTFEDWLADALGRRVKRPTIRTFLRRNDQDRIVRRWVDLLGPDRVTVVIADKRRPELLIDTFEDLLGVPRGTTAARPAGGYVTNRGLSAPEVELVRRINRTIDEQGYDWRRYTDLIRHGVIAGMQECRRPGPDEQPIRLPQWAAERALRTAAEYAEAIAGSGCQVVGDLSQLTAPVRTVADCAPPEQIPADAVREAVAGLISAADGLGPFFGQAAEGVEGRRRTDPRLERFADAETTERILNGYRATRHLTAPAMMAVLGQRLADGVGRRAGAVGRTMGGLLSGRASPASRRGSDAD